MPWRRGAMPGIIHLLWWPGCRPGHVLHRHLRRHNRCGGGFRGCNCQHCRALGIHPAGTHRKGGEIDSGGREKDGIGSADARAGAGVFLLTELCFSTQLFILVRS